uniref:Adaptin ear-binding coat-associated protein 1 n=2 Tax=Oncorhynchus tshawytscha TaxID=74940 RepID=A0AAZ3R7W4_ONCTS
MCAGSMHPLMEHKLRSGIPITSSPYCEYIGHSQKTKGTINKPHINLIYIKMSTEGEYESILCVKPDVNVYRIPPRATNRGYRAADWKLDVPDWSGRMRITAKGKVAYIKLEDKVSGELFAQAPVTEYPGIAVETVSDSSRYFVLRIQDDNGRSAFIGVGFADRGDSFDFNVSLQDHFKWVKQENEISKNPQGAALGPKLDLGFKDGQTITLNIGQGKKRDKPRPQGAGGLGLLPPPPKGKMAPPPSSAFSNHNTVPQTGGSDTGCLLDLDSSNSNTVVQSSNPSSDLWGDFSSPASSLPPTSRQEHTPNWGQF